MQQWHITREPDEADLRIISDGVVQYGRSLASDGNAKPIACLLRMDGEIIAGATGHTEYERLFVLYLWVTPSLRGQGLGTEALRLLEEAGRREGCRDALIETLSDRTAQLYKRLGYRELPYIASYVGPFNKHILLKELGSESGGV
jgi:GNAT superfamily N-acetyltransferase